MHYLPGKRVKVALRRAVRPMIAEFDDRFVSDERLSKAHLIILEFLRVNGSSTAQQVGDTCYTQTHYDQEGLVANQASIHKRWANRVLHSLSHAQRARCSPEGLWARISFDDHNLRDLSHNDRTYIARDVRQALHASRNHTRDLRMDTTKIAFNIHDAYYGEAWGILRALVSLRYGVLQPTQRVHTLEGGRYPASTSRDLNVWFHEIEQQVLADEHFGGNNECDYCMDRYGRDGAGRTRGLLEMNSMKKSVDGSVRSFRYVKGTKKDDQ
jgi:hypothetical protein